MNARIFVTVTFSYLLVVTSSLVFAQERQPPKEVQKGKPLDAFISATTKASADPGQTAGVPVPGAEITVAVVRHGGVVTTGEEMEIVGLGFEKNRVYKTNEQGEFTLLLNRDQFEKLPEKFHFKFTIKPSTPYDASANVVYLKVKQPNSPKLDFVVTYIRARDQKGASGATNKGTFAVNSKAQT